MLTTKKHHQVVAAVIVDDGEVLCMQRGQSKFPYTSYKWEFVPKQMVRESKNDSQ